MVWGNIISAGAGLFGGLFGRGGDDAGDIAATEQANSLAIARENMAMQREFAQQGLKWRVDDAIRSGIHPLYALGASLPSYSPATYVPGQYTPDREDNSWIGQAGQDIGRAVAATMDKSQRSASRMAMLAEDRAELENAILRARLAKETAQIGPSFPDAATPGLSSTAIPAPAIPGQGDLVEVKKVENPTVTPGDPTSQAGAGPDRKWVQTRTGWKEMPSEYLKLDDMDITNPEYLSWWWRNRAIPALPGSARDLNPPPWDFLPPGAKGWVFRGGEYQPVYDWNEVGRWENARGRPNIK